MRKASKTVLIPPGTDFCTQLHYIHIAVFSSGNFFENLGSTPENISDGELGVDPGSTPNQVLDFFNTFSDNEKKVMEMKKPSPGGLIGGEKHYLLP